MDDPLGAKGRHGRLQAPPVLELGTGQSNDGGEEHQGSLHLELNGFDFCPSVAVRLFGNGSGMVALGLRAGYI